MERSSGRSSGTRSDPPTVFLEPTAVDSTLSFTGEGVELRQREREESFSSIRYGGEEDPTSEPTSLILGTEKRAVTEIRHAKPPEVLTRPPRLHQLEREETFSSIRYGGEEDTTSEPTLLILGAEQRAVTEVRRAKPPAVLARPPRHRRPRTLLFKIAIAGAGVVVVAVLVTLIALLVSRDECGEKEVEEEEDSSPEIIASLTVALELVGITQIIQSIATMNTFEDVCGEFFAGLWRLQSQTLIDNLVLVSQATWVTPPDSISRVQDRLLEDVENLVELLTNADPFFSPLENVTLILDTADLPPPVP